MKKKKVLSLWMTCGILSAPPVVRLKRLFAYEGFCRVCPVREYGRASAAELRTVRDSELLIRLRPELRRLPKLELPPGPREDFDDFFSSFPNSLGPPRPL